MFPTELATKMKPNINSVVELRNNGHPVHGALVGAGALWPFALMVIYIQIALLSC